MNSLIPSYAVLANHLKWRQGKIFSTLMFSVCFMQMSYLLKKQKIQLPNSITVFTFLEDKIIHILGRKQTTK